jgi:hypothetical protein
MPDTTTRTPILTGRVQTGDDITLRPEVYDLNGQMAVRATFGDEEILIPAQLLRMLGRYANAMASDLTRNLSDGRREFMGDLTQMGLVESYRTEHYIRAGHDATADGVPHLRWVSHTPRSAQSGWELYLRSDTNIAVGFAPWNDRAALTGLIESMDDPDTLMIMAGITQPVQTAELSARIAARALRTARALPGIDLKKVRTALVAGGLIDAPGAQTRTRGGRIRLLTITSGTKDVPVAVAVKAPEYGFAPVQTSDQERATLSPEELTERLTQREELHAAAWLVRVQQTLAAAGWRAVGLPSPRRQWYDDPFEVKWFTRFDTDTWSTVEAAARAAALKVSLNRGGII